MSVQLGVEIWINVRKKLAPQRSPRGCWTTNHWAGMDWTGPWYAIIVSNNYLDYLELPCS